MWKTKRLIKWELDRDDIPSSKLHYNILAKERLYIIFSTMVQTKPYTVFFGARFNDGKNRKDSELAFFTIFDSLQ